MLRYSKTSAVAECWMLTAAYTPSSPSPTPTPLGLLLSLDWKPQVELLVFKIFVRGSILHIKWNTTTHGPLPCQTLFSHRCKLPRYSYQDHWQTICTSTELTPYITSYMPLSFASSTSYTIPSLPLARPLSYVSFRLLRKLIRVKPTSGRRERQQ
jgi:hypothetical protein